MPGSFFVFFCFFFRGGGEEKIIIRITDLQSRYQIISYDLKEDFFFLSCFQKRKKRKILLKCELVRKLSRVGKGE